MSHKFDFIHNNFADYSAKNYPPFERRLSLKKMG